LLFSFLIFLVASEARAVSFNVSPDDEVYGLLEEMEAVGAIEAQIWGIRPFTEKEVARLLAEARKNEARLSPYLRRRLQELWPRFRGKDEREPFFKPVEDPRFAFLYSSEERPLENFRGRSLSENNLFLGFQSKWLVSENLLFHSEFEIAYVNGSRDFYRGQFLMGYGRIGLGHLSLEVGVDSIWWDEAYTGNLLFSLNPPPFAPLCKLESEQPMLLPWYFRYLGPFKFSVFVSRLEKERVVPEPWLIGMKMNFKPHPRLEIGLTRSIMCGGKVEDGPNLFEGDQKAGIEMRIRPVDHLAIYFEAYGEDETWGLPGHCSYIMGVYAPGLFSRLGIRLEYTYIAKWWYHHHVYQSGYTYKNWLIGYYTDRTVRNYFGELTFDLTASMRLSANYWKEKRYNTQEIFLYDVSRYQVGFIKHLFCAHMPLELKITYRFNDYGAASSIADDHQFSLFLNLIS
jgi:hypothetical protein